MTTTMPEVPGVRESAPAPDKPRRVKRGGGVMSSTGLYIATGIAGFFFLVPFYLLIRNALSTDADITGGGQRYDVMPPAAVRAASQHTCSARPLSSVRMRLSILLINAASGCEHRGAGRSVVTVQVTPLCRARPARRCVMLAKEALNA